MPRCGVAAASRRIAAVFEFLGGALTDYVARDAQAMVRTIEGPQPLGVLWRRIDGAFADPLDETVAADMDTQARVAGIPLDVPAQQTTATDAPPLPILLENR